MKKLTLLLALILGTTVGCSQEEQNVEVVINQSPLPLIPATAISCAAKQNAGDSAPVADITENYFRIPIIRFVRKDATKNFEVAAVKIVISTPGSSQGVNCVVAGQALSALSDPGTGGIWGVDAIAEIPAGTADFSTNCALYCGGISAASRFTATGTMTVYGVEKSTDGTTETPVVATTPITIESLF